MGAKLTDELRNALALGDGAPLPIEDEQTQKVYVLVDQPTHQRAMQALREQEDLKAIRAGIEDAQAGRTVSVDEADDFVRSSLGFPHLSQDALRPEEL
jgi:predicted transcriptional regulator